MLRLMTRLAVLAAAVVAFSINSASAQDKRVRIQMGGAFPSTTGLLGPTQLSLVETIRKVSGGSIDIRFFEPGALVPASQYLDAVGNGSLDAAWTVSGFWTGKDIAFAMYASVPVRAGGGRVPRLDEARRRRAADEGAARQVQCRGPARAG